MLKNVVIADTSSLIVLSNIHELELLKDLYGQILITPEVYAEYGITTPSWIEIRAVEHIEKLQALSLNHDLGESSAIALALKTENSLLIIDEKKGRNVAVVLNLRIKGLLGVLVKAKKLGVIETVTPLINKMEASGFRVSKVIKKTNIN